jgi:hypothetical protein
LGYGIVLTCKMLSSSSKLVVGVNCRSARAMDGNGGGMQVDRGAKHLCHLLGNGRGSSPLSVGIRSKLVFVSKDGQKRICRGWRTDDELLLIKFPIWPKKFRLAKDFSFVQHSTFASQARRNRCNWLTRVTYSSFSDLLFSLRNSLAPNAVSVSSHYLSKVREAAITIAECASVDRNHSTNFRHTDCIVCSRPSCFNTREKGGSMFQYVM